MIKRKVLSSAMLLAFAMALPSTGMANNPEKTDQLLIQTGAPKRSIETAFSSFVSWHSEKGSLNQGAVNKSNGLAFIKGTKNKKTITASDVSKKAAGALIAGIKNEAPSDRGVIVELNKNKAEFLIYNKAGFAIDRFTTRDYTNQEISYSIPGKSFANASVDISINLVYTAVVEYNRDFVSDIKLEPAGGSISLMLDNDAPIVLQTKGKSTEQLEVEIAQALGSKADFSSAPIYPNFTEIRSKNFKAFDGGEVQLLRLNARSITIDINDSGLGVLTKFRFPNSPKSENSSDNMLPIFGFLIAAGLGYFFYNRKKEV